MVRELVRIQRYDFQGFGCSACGWRFKPSGALVGKSINEMKRDFEAQRDKDFASHVCSQHPRQPK
jgi:hypothetical protein